MDKIFSGGISLARANPFGLALMAVALLMTIFARPITARFAQGRKNVYSGIRLAAVIICAIGALIAIL